MMNLFELFLFYFRFLSFLRSILLGWLFNMLSLFFNGSVGLVMFL
jgi:hypothetical protein